MQDDGPAVMIDSIWRTRTSVIDSREFSAMRPSSVSGVRISVLLTSGTGPQIDLRF